MTHDEELAIAAEHEYIAMQKAHEAAAWKHGYKPVNKVMICKWVKALRSGCYKQGSKWLVYQTQASVLDKPITPETCAYCATGVLCDLINPLAWFNYAIVRTEVSFLRHEGMYRHKSIAVRRVSAARWWAPMMLLNKRTIHKPVRVANGGATPDKFKYGPMDKCTANLPSGVALRLLELGISSDNIVRMNDVVGASFDEIADRIEQVVL